MLYQRERERERESSQWLQRDDMMILKWVLPAIQLRVSLSFTLNLPHLFSASDSELEREREREREGLRVQIGERESLSFYNLFKFEVKSTL